MSAKKYTDELAEWARKKQSSRPRSIAKITFMALKKDIEEALNSGFTMLMIWEHLKETERLAVSYNTFTKYVSLHITNKKQSPATLQQSPATSPATPAAVKKPAVKTEKETKPAASRDRELGSGFHYNPSPNPKDLL